jgi:hypothetical protein
MDNKPKYVLLRGIEWRNKFFCFNLSDDPTKLYNGEIAYEVLGYADTVAEAQVKLYGRSFTDCKD